MIVLIARLTIAESQREIFLHHASDFVTQSRAEDGCLRFDVSENIQSANHFVVTEIWEDEAALHGHEASEHLAQFKSQIKAFIVEREPTQVYDANEIFIFN